MRNKIIIRFGPKFSFPLDLHFIQFRKGLSGLLDLFLKLSTIGVFIFLACILAFDFFSGNSGEATIYAIYIAVIIGITLQTAKIILGKGDFLPQVYFDLPLLAVTTVVACSLFVATVVFKNNTNIWGGTGLHSISGVIIIAYWFIFYLISANIRDRRTLRRALTMLWCAPIVTLFFWLITFKELSASQLTIFGLMVPGTLWLLLTQKKNQWLHLINLIISISLLVISGYKFIIFITFLIALLSFIFLVITKRNQLQTMFTTLQTIDRKTKFNFWTYLNTNAAVIYMLISLATVLGGLFWIKNNLSPSFFNPILIGASLLKFPNFINLLLGNGLNSVNASLIIQFIYSFGILPVIFLIAMAALMFRNTYRVYKKTTSSKNRGLWLWILSSLGSFFFYLLFTALTPEIIILYCVILITFSGIFTTLIGGSELQQLDLNLRDFNHLKRPNLQLFIRTLQIMLLILIFLAAIYLLSSLNYINIFIVA